MEEFYTVTQAAIFLKVHPLTIRRYIKEGKLKAYKAGGNIRISVNDLRAFTQSFIPRQKSTKSTTNSSEITVSKSFSVNDPLLRLKARGLSISKLE